jgi:hydroxymethylpyrimidine/phosphomethylpyrimidine kinase
MKIKHVLSIAATDTSGNAGIQRDIKTFHDLGVNGLSVITGVTAQTNEKVFSSEALPTEQVAIQLKTVFDNYHISAVKIGVVSNKEIMECISNFLKKHTVSNILIDPIIKASDEYSFIEKDNYLYMKDEFLKTANIITPNVPELESLSEITISNETALIKASKLISEKYDAYIFAKGGHLKDKNIITDYLIKGTDIEAFPNPNAHLSHIHGTGCLISSAITAFIALDHDIKTAIVKAKEYFYSFFD